MSDSSANTTLLKSLGAIGSKRVTGVTLVTGDYIAVQAVDDMTFLGETEGNMENISGLSLSAGDSIVGEWRVLHTSGECIFYKG